MGEDSEIPGVGGFLIRQSMMLVTNRPIGLASVFSTSTCHQNRSNAMCTPSETNIFVLIFELNRHERLVGEIHPIRSGQRDALPNSTIFLIQERFHLVVNVIHFVLVTFSRFDKFFEFFHHLLLSFDWHSGTQHLDTVHFEFCLLIGSLIF